MVRLQKKTIIIAAIVFALAASAVFVALVLTKISANMKDGLVFELKSETRISELVQNIEAGELQDSDQLINTSTVGKHSQEVVIKSKVGTTKTYVVAYDIVDTTAPSIEGETIINCYKNECENIKENFKFSDNSDEALEVTIEGDYDPSQKGNYSLKIKAKDVSGNTAEKDFTLEVGGLSPTIAKYVKSGKPEYYIEVNRKQNVVMIYTLDQTGNYTKLIRTFVSSVGRAGHETPTGTFTVSDHYETRYLYGNVWGHYAVRIHGDILFHSVPYFTKGAPWDDLEYKEYNKLGEGASLGCVRLAVIDAKWIYDNIPSGTKVKIYDADQLPRDVTKPTPIKIDESSPNRGWDPTDPDSRNPWKAK